jgi:hypothetical protein
MASIFFTKFPSAFSSGGLLQYAAWRYDPATLRTIKNHARALAQT